MMVKVESRMVTMLRGRNDCVGTLIEKLECFGDVL